MSKAQLSTTIAIIGMVLLASAVMSVLIPELAGAQEFVIEGITVNPLPSIFSWNEDNNYTFVISNYFTDLVGDSITYTNSNVNNISVAYTYNKSKVYNLSKNISWYGEESAAYLGEGLSSRGVNYAGDFNGDGYDDILIGSHGYKSNAGKAYLMYGPAVLSNPNITYANLSFYGESTNAYAASALSSAGDFNGDGYDDILVGAYGSAVGTGNPGKVYLIYGRAGLNGAINLSNTTIINVTFYGEAHGDRAGWALSNAGDLNNDGYDDILIGAPINAACGSMSGKTYLIFGRPNLNGTFNLSNQIVVNLSFCGGNASIESGYALRKSGDINGDGYKDIIIGAPLSDTFSTDSGEVFVVYGPFVSGTYNYNLSAYANLSFFGENATDLAGVSIDSGDFNGDRYADILIGAGQADYTGLTRCGKAYIIYGSSSLLGQVINLSDNGFVGATFYGTTNSAYLGYSVSNAGDIDEDGYDDMLLGAFGPDKAYFIYGSSNLPSLAEISSSANITWAAEGDLGMSVSNAGDYNKDELSDLLIAAPANDSNRGRVYLIYGNATNVNPVNATLIPAANFNTDAMSDPGMIFYANATDGDWNWNGPVLLDVVGINDYPQFSGLIANATFNEDTNYSINITAYFNDVENGRNLTYVTNSTLTSFTVLYNSTSGNMTFVPAPNFNGWRAVVIKATDSNSASNYSNQFILNVLPVPDNLTNIANISNITWQEDTIYSLNLTDYFYDPDNTTVYGYDSPTRPMYIAVFVNSTTGYTRFTPNANWYGYDDVNLTAIEPDTGIQFSQIVGLNVTDVQDEIRFNTSALVPNITIAEDSYNDSINVSQRFYYPAGQTIYYGYNYTRSKLICHFDSGDLCSKAIDNSLGISSSAGYFDEAYSFDSNNSFVKLNHSSDLNASAYTGLTIEAWINPSSNSTIQSVIEKNMSFQIYLTQTDIICSLHDTSNWVTLIASNAVNVGEWTHIACAYDGASRNLYINGNLADSQSTSAINDKSYPIFIGNVANLTRDFNGSIDEVRIFNYSRNADEINGTYKYEYPFVKVDIDSNSIANLTSEPDFYGLDYITFTAYNSSGASNESNEIFVNFTSVNDVPVLNNTIPNKEWIKDSNTSFSLENVFYDPEGQPLTYNYSISTGNIAVIINQTSLNVTLAPASGWYGTAYLVITANDSMNTTNSNNITLEVYELNHIIVITPSGVQRGTVPIVYVLSNFQNTTVSVNATFSTDSGASFATASGDSLTNLSMYNVSEMLSAGSDALVDSQNSSANYDGTTAIEAGSYGSRIVRSALKFDMPFVANSSFIANATLRLFQTYAVGEARTIGVCKINESWDSSNVTYSNQPAYTDCVSNVSVSNTLEYKSWDVTELVKGWIDNSSSNYGMMLKDIYEPNSIGLHTFASSEYGGNSTPQLVINYKGNQYVFYWESIPDIGHTYQANMRINITERSTGATGGTIDFVVDNNNPPEINTTTSSDIIMYEDTPLRLNVSNYFYDADNQTLSTTFTQGVNVTITLFADEKSSEFAVSGATDYQGKPKIVIDSNDNRYFAWQDRRNGNYDIYLAKFSPANVLVSETRVTSNSTDQSEPDLAIDGADNKYLVWTDKRNGNKDIYLAKYNSSDSLVYNLSVDTNTSDQSNPALAYDNGKLYVFWEQAVSGNTEIGYVFLNATNGQNVTSVLVTSGGLNYTEPSLAVDEGNNKYLVDIFSHNQTDLVIWNSSDSFVGNAGGINTDSYIQSHPSVAFDTFSNDALYIVWADSNGISNYSNIKLAKWNISAFNIDSLVNITTGDTPRFNPEVAVDSDGNVYVVYENHLNNQADIYFTKLDKDLNITYTRNITTNNQTQSVPDLAIDSNDKKIVVWQHRGASDDVYAIELSAELMEILLTPDANFYGNDSFILTVNDSYNATSRQLNITVLSVDDPPVLVSSIPAISWLEGSYNDSLNLSSYFIEVEGQNLTYSSTTPQNITFSISVLTNIVNLSSSATFSGTRYITFSASDGALSTDSNNVTLSVINVNNAPVVNFLGIITAITEDWTVQHALDGYVLDIDNADSEINWTAGGYSNAVVTINNTASPKTVTITPAANYTGNISINFTAADPSDANDSKIVIFTVTPINDAPALNLSSLIPNQTIQIDGTAAITLSSHFYDVDGDNLGFSATSAQNITIAINNATDSALITPGPGFSGVRYTVFTAYDPSGLNRSSNNVTINVTAITSEFINTYVNGSGPYDGNFSNITGTFNSTLTDSNVTDDTSSINYTTIINTTVTSSYLISSTISFSTINNSKLTDCTVRNSTVKNYVGANCTIVDSVVDPPTPSSSIIGSNVKGNSNVTSSNLTNSDVDNSNVTDSNISSCEIDNSTIFGSIIDGCNITNANLTSNVIYNGTITCAASTYDADTNGSTGLVNITNYAPTALFATSHTSAETGVSILFNASNSSDPNIPGLLGDSLNYSWNFGDGNVTNTASAEINHSYSSAATYNPVLTVTDEFSASDTDTKTVTITSPAGTGGGGGGGGGGTSVRCTEKWICAEWGPCGSTNVQYRDCYDNSSCGTSVSKPSVTGGCTYVPTCTDRIQNQDEEGIDCGGSCTACPAEEAPIVEAQPLPPQAEQPSPEVTVPAEEPAPEFGMKLIALVLILIFVLVGLFVGGGVAVSRHRHFAYLDAAKGAIGETLRQGYKEDDIRESMLRLGWNRYMVDTAIKEVNVEILQRSIRRNLAKGADESKIMEKMLEKGWPRSVVKEAFKGLKSKGSKNAK